MFRRKTEEEKEIARLEIRLHKLKAKRDFLIPKPRRKLFSKYEIKNDISFNMAIHIQNIEDEINELKDRLGRN